MVIIRTIEVKFQGDLKDIMNDKKIEQTHKVMNFETCQHRKNVDVMGIKKRSLFCDFDDVECDESNGKCRNQRRFLVID